MIKIDKTDDLYKYLINLGVENVEKEYVELANNGRYKRDDIRQYFRDIFNPSKTNELEEKDLEKVIDYYVDLKKVKHVNSKQLKDLLVNYKTTKDSKIKEQIVNSQLKDVLYLCLNYLTLHKDVDIQDVVQVANFGLLEAIEKYNEQAKIDFKDYLVYYTRKSILNEFKEKNND